MPNDNIKGTPSVHGPQRHTHPSSSKRNSDHMDTEKAIEPSNARLASETRVQPTRRRFSFTSASNASDASHPPANMGNRTLKRARVEGGDVVTDLPSKRALHEFHNIDTSTVAVSVAKSTRKRDVFPFFEFSGELRNQIYECLVHDLTEDTFENPIALKICFSSPKRSLNGRSQVKGILKNAAGLGHTSSQLRSESWPLLWGRVKFYLCHCTLSDARCHSLKMIGKLMVLPPMITGPRELGCGRITRLTVSKSLACGIRDWVFTPYALAEQLVAVLMRLEFCGEVEMTCRRYEAKLFSEVLNDAINRVRSKTTTSFTDAMRTFRSSAHVDNMLVAHTNFLSYLEYMKDEWKEAVHCTIPINLLCALESRYADVEPHSVPYWRDRRDLRNHTDIILQQTAQQRLDSLSLLISDGSQELLVLL